jgi:hypothetical protein
VTGLLDFIKTGTTGNPALDQGLLQAGLSLLQAKGNFGSNLGQAGMQALAGMQNAQNQQFQRTLQKNQLEELQRKRVLEDLPGQFIKPAQTGIDATGGMETATSNPANYVPPQMDLAGLAQKYLGTPGGLQQGLALQQSLKKDTTPIKVGAGDTLVNPQTLTPVYTAPNKEDPLPSAVREYNFAKSQGYKGTFEDWERTGRKLSAPQTSIKIDNKLGEGLAKEVGPMIAASAEQASGANQQIANADSLIKAIDSNQVYAGPGANIRLKAAQVGQVIGVGGKDAAESIANTRSVIQGLARATTAARAALKGQGSVSDFEGKLLAKAESGDIEDMTPAEIRQIAVVNKRLAGQLVQNHQKLLDRAKKNPATAQTADFFEVPTPSTEQSVRRYNPATGKIE